jgi:hypothetical protein
MKKTIYDKEYNLPKEVVDYIDELEYYHYFLQNKRVIEIHYGIVGHIIGLYPNYEAIPKELIDDKDKFFKTLGAIVNESHKLIQWLFVQDEKTPKVYAYPFVFWRIMPASEDIIESDEEIDGEIASDS